ncbi:MAG: hypothetical protein IT370_17185 [Deltaproteobacteria bacterium]|nr:hypothetical protein [Deltaproteobacteria bacterium]
MSDEALFPAAVRELAERCIEACRRALGGLEMDYSEESLALLDHWIGQAPPDKPEMIDLVAPMAGAYFGELARRRLGGAWVLRGLEPGSWRVEVKEFGLSFSPVGMAAEAVARGDAEGYDATLAAAGHEAVVATRLGELPEVTEEEFYSLTGRLEALVVVVDFLADLKRQDAEDEAADKGGEAAEDDDEGDEGDEGNEGNEGDEGDEGDGAGDKAE